MVLVGMGDRIKVLRDWALLPIGVRRGLRGSELSAINCRVGRFDSSGDHSVESSVATLAGWVRAGQLR